MNEGPHPAALLDLTAIRARLNAARGREYWRSLDELAATPEFEELLHREFPRLASGWEGGELNRRHFLKLMGASLAFAGLQACSRQPLEKMVPYVRQPEEVVPGQPLTFATAMTLGGYATGLLVESQMGRPIKVEGNPDHPASLGATDPFAQASVLGLYDPDRSQVVTQLGGIRTWNDFLGDLAGALRAQRALRGAGLRILTETVTSPTLADQLESLLAELPAARWHQYEPGGRDSARNGARLAFGEILETRYDLRQAEVILTLDSDFLTTGPGCLRYARDFADKRRIRQGVGEMNRLYAVESTPTSTGTLADHRLPLPASEVAAFALALAAELEVAGATGATPPPSRPLGLEAKLWVTAVARDLRSHRGSGLVVAGDPAPAAVHVLAHAMNLALGNFGRTVATTAPVEAHPVDQLESIGELAGDMAAGRVDMLVILGGNPLYTAPADLHFADAMRKVRLAIHLGLYEDETSEFCHWHLPQAHELESWSDARAYDGTVTILQPLIEPLYGGKTVHELLSAMSGRPELTAYELVRATWQKRAAGEEFERFWRKAVHDGVITGTALAPKPAALNVPAVVGAARELAELGAAPASAGHVDIELNFRLDPTVHDGRFANNGWLQELPKPWSRLTWDNAALLSPSTAERLGLHNEDVVALSTDGEGKVEAPVWILPGHADRSITVHLGYGRRRGGRVGSGTGFDSYLLRTSPTPWLATRLTVSKVGSRYPLATTQDHHSMEGRALVRSGTLGQYEQDPEFARKMGHEPEQSLYPGFAYDGYAWGLAVDLGACLGCNACVVACQAENNIPVVGKEQVIRGREMHWLRIDRYWSGDLDRPNIDQQPVMCMHCEQAPCEVVCPVAATVHSDEGLNEMVYNRCVGTRYCSNNCPYKVRRFNFLQYTDAETPVLKLLRNPDVTVRERGVMEKCTYCVQRINQARITAKKENRSIRDGEVVTACQQACPTRAIVFGDINDPHSEVSKWKADPLNYALLAELNTRPRTTYLAKLRNPNPELEGLDDRKGA